MHTSVQGTLRGGATVNSKDFLERVMDVPLGEGGERIAGLVEDLKWAKCAWDFL